MFLAAVKIHEETETAASLKSQRPQGGNPAAVRTIPELDHVAALTRKAWAEGQIPDSAAEAVCNVL